jgi:deoxyribodipyrimidine photo-lyase
MMFPTDYESILTRISSINPIEYAKSRNYIDGEVTYLSPYLTHGVISTKDVAYSVLNQYSPTQTKKLIQELCWREYFQSVNRSGEVDIWSDIRFDQPDVVHHGIPQPIEDINTGIHALDTALTKLLETGYMHNHERMWLAALVCNHAHYHWKQPSQGLYYYLLDGDIASNTLSWQWVAGSFSSKQYIANQENINTYSKSVQRNTFLDTSYEHLSDADISDTWNESKTFNKTTDLSDIKIIEHSELTDTLIYHPWMLDPQWNKESQQRRVLLLDSNHFKKYPISSKRLEYILALAQNIPGIEIYQCDISSVTFQDCVTREHPNIKDWQLLQQPQSLLVPELQSTYHKNFFSFWKKAEKHLGC